jgi:superfamily II DNA or RNA helicase
MKEKLKQELNKRGLTELPYQVDLLTNPIYQTNDRLVFAAGTSAGKTLTTILWLEINQPKSALIVPASKTILRDNFEVEIEKFNPTFSYSIVTNKTELQKAITDKVQVIVALPQTLNKNYNLLPKLDMFILDEAHQWYFKSTIRSIVKHTKPKKQLLLTGSPSKFVADGNFTFKFVPVMELYDLGHVSNAKVEVVSSSYDFKQSDWLSSYGNLKSSKTNSPKKAKEALEMVCDEMLLKLQSKTNGKYLRNWKGANKISKLFNELDKTIIYTHSKKQADTFYKILNEKMNGQVLLSHSESDSKSELFAQFQNDTNIKILVAVDRGRLGFNMPELFNIVDFTMTQSLDMLLQMYGRLLRKSNNNPDKTKIYFKVATKNTADYFVDLMTAMLCLTNMEWYSKYNGKNMSGIRIPKVLMSNRKRVKVHNSSHITQSQRQTKPYISLVELGIPNDLNIFRQSVIHTSDGIFDTIAETTLGDVRNEILLLNNSESRVKHWNYEKVKSTIDSLKYVNEIKNVKGLIQAVNRYNLKDYASKKLINGKIKWRCEDDIRIEFKKYKTKKELCTKARGAVGAAKDMGVYKKLCDEMGWPDRMFATENKEWVKKTCKKIKCYDFETMRYIKTYNSIREAERDLGITEIKRVLSGEYKRRKNYYFNYA